MPSNTFAMGTQTIPPGGRLGARAFEVGEAVFFVYGGTGRVIVNGTWRAIAPETLVYVGRDATHDIENDGAEHLALAWIATPPGLDGLMRAIGRARTPGTAEPMPFDAPENLAAACRRARIVLA
jgi:hypothetical protein